LAFLSDKFCTSLLLERYGGIFDPSVTGNRDLKLFFNVSTPTQRETTHTPDDNKEHISINEEHEYRYVAVAKKSIRVA